MHARPEHLAGVLSLLVLACGGSGPGSATTKQVPGIDHSFEANLRQLLSRNAQLRKLAFEVFQRNWAAARHHVSALAGRRNKAERVAGAYLMMRLATHQDLPALRRFLVDHHAPVRLAAIAGVQRLRDTASIPMLTRLLASASYVESQHVLEALAVIDPEASEPIIVENSKAEAWSRRRAATQALGHLTTSTSVRRLLELIADPIWLVRMDAARALGRRRVSSACAALRTAARDDSDRVRAAAIQALAEIGEPEDQDLVLRTAMAEGSETVRVAAVESLRGISGDKAVSVLDKIVNSPKEPESIKKAAIQSLGGHAAPRARTLFEKLLASDNAALRKLAETTVVAKKLPWAKVGDAWRYTPAKSPR